jgi:hypothetical protein
MMSKRTMPPPKAGHALWESLLHGRDDAWMYIDEGPSDPITPLGRVLQRVRFSSGKILHTKDLAGLPGLDTDEDDIRLRTSLLPTDMADLEQAECFFWPIAGLAPPEPDQRPVPRYLYITMPHEGVPAATLPLDRYFDLSRLEHLDVGFGGPVNNWTDLSWLAVIPSTLQTVCITCDEARILRSLLEGLRPQTRLETLDLFTRMGHSIADINPLKYFPTLRRLDLVSINDLEHLVDYDHQCLETLSVSFSSTSRGLHGGVFVEEYLAHHPAHRFADAFRAARAENPSLLPALKTLIISNGDKLSSSIWNAWVNQEDDEDLDIPFGFKELVWKLREEGVGVED